MIAVIFELQPKVSKANQYFEIANTLKPLLDNIDGFISIERFQSLSDPTRYLSLSYWRDEEAVSAWRNNHLHRTAQQTGRDSIFADYRLRVAQITRDYTLLEREQVPADSCAYFVNL